MDAARNNAVRIPGESGIWFVVFAELMAFTVFFSVALVYRIFDPSSYSESILLQNQLVGLLNTVILITSSLTAAGAVHAVKNGEERRASRLVLVTIGLGLLFVAVKYFEWGSKIERGITLNANPFFMTYYVFTGIHLAHVLIGLALLISVYRALQRGAALKITEIAALFWHLVDLLWIILFTLFYLLR